MLRNHARSMTIVALITIDSCKRGDATNGSIFPKGKHKMQMNRELLLTIVIESRKKLKRNFYSGI